MIDHLAENTPEFHLLDQVWDCRGFLPPSAVLKPKDGRPRMSGHKALGMIIYIIITGTPRELLMNATSGLCMHGHEGNVCFWIGS